MGGPCNDERISFGFGFSVSTSLLAIGGSLARFQSLSSNGTARVFFGASTEVNFEEGSDVFFP